MGSACQLRPTGVVNKREIASHDSVSAHVRQTPRTTRFTAKAAFPLCQFLRTEEWPQVPGDGSHAVLREVKINKAFRLQFVTGSCHQHSGGFDRRVLRQSQFDGPLLVESYPRQRQDIGGHSEHLHKRGLGSFELTGCQDQLSLGFGTIRARSDGKQTRRRRKSLRRHGTDR